MPLLIQYVVVVVSLFAIHFHSHLEMLKFEIEKTTLIIKLNVNDLDEEFLMCHVYRSALLTAKDDLLQQAR